jgi:divalent metal cation (Fe/Co/Zn/Cd) transporter
VHEVIVQSIEGKLRMEQHVELNEGMTLAEAHNFVTAMEAEILRDVPELKSVLTHIESEPGTIERASKLAGQDSGRGQVESESERIGRSLRVAAKNFPEIVDVHEILVGRSGEHIHVSCHCTLPDALTMRDVHTVITGLEDRLKLECPEVHRVLIHPEPVTDNHR